MLTARFCDNASSFMRQIPAEPVTAHLSPAVARDDLRNVLQSTVRGFAQLAATAPSRLRPPLKTIIGVYQSDERALHRSANLARISEAMATGSGSGSGSAAFQQVLTFISVNCK